MCVWPLVLDCQIGQGDRFLQVSPVYVKNITEETNSNSKKLLYVNINEELLTHVPWVLENLFGLEIQEGPMII